MQIQTNHVRNLDMGFQRDGLIVLRGFDRPDVKNSLDALRNQILAIPGVTAAALSGPVPTDGRNSDTTMRRAGEPEEKGRATNLRIIDYDFLDTYKVELLAGRKLSREFGADDLSGTDAEKAARGGNVLVNQRALRHFGFSSREDAIGQQLTIDTGPNPTDKIVATIVGVVANVQVRSARDELPAAVFYYDAGGFDSMTVRYSGLTKAEAQAALESVWKSTLPLAAFRADFMDELVDNQYRDERAQGRIFTAFASLAVIVACLGLYGLAAFSAERRTKEIGLRKALGARVGDILRLLLWQFAKPVAIANVLAWPVAYFIMLDWLNGFEFRVALSPAYFVAAGAAALLIAWLTVGAHALRVARANPIHALRYE